MSLLKLPQLDPWERNDVQFPRLLAECYAVLSRDQIDYLAESMGLDVDQVHELFERAEETTEHKKKQLGG